MPDTSKHRRKQESEAEEKGEMISWSEKSITGKEGGREWAGEGGGDRGGKSKRK